jgi:hypothetical protein
MNLPQEIDPRAGEAVAGLTSALLDDHATMESAIRNNGWDIRYASPRLQRDSELRNIALKHVALRPGEDPATAMLDFLHLLQDLDPRACEVMAGLTPALLDDHATIKNVLHKNGWAIRYVSPRLQRDRELRKIACTRIALRPGESSVTARTAFNRMIHAITAKVKRDRKAMGKGGKKKSGKKKSGREKSGREKVKGGEGACGHCGEDGAVECCGRCRIVCYCNATCQKASWKVHKITCKAI